VVWCMKEKDGGRGRGSDEEAEKGEVDSVLN
jgi:hypothetical protein